MAVTICIILRDVCFSGVSSAYCAQLFSLSGVWHSVRSEEHTSELQSQSNLVCRLLLEKKNSWRYHKCISLLRERIRSNCFQQCLPSRFCVLHAVDYVGRQGSSSSAS